MKARQILKQRKVLEDKRKDKEHELSKQLKKKVQLSKIKAAKHIIEKMKIQPEYEQALNYLARNAHIEDNQKSGYCSVSDDIGHYEDINGCWKSLIPESESFWPDKSECIPTKKIIPALLRNYCKEIEKVCDIKCWWGYGFMSHTHHNLKVSVSHNLVMYFEFNGVK